MLIHSMSVSVDGFIADRPGAALADVWHAIPKVVFSRTLDRVQGARLAEGSVAEEIAAALDATDERYGRARDQSG